MPATATQHEPQVMQCMEVWGGNQAVDSGVVMAGLGDLRPGLSTTLVDEPAVAEVKGRLAMAEAARRSYELTEIKHWLRIFLHRFFALSQFKRSALPNGPKVMSGGNLSPRGDWRAPSDASAAVWLEELEKCVP